MAPTPWSLEVSQSAFSVNVVQTMHFSPAATISSTSPSRMSHLPGSDFFFQAKDGIRDRDVTGVQTCALPISKACFFFQAEDGIRGRDVTGVQTCALPI